MCKFIGAFGNSSHFLDKNYLMLAKKNYDLLITLISISAWTSEVKSLKYINSTQYCSEISELEISIMDSLYDVTIN